MTTISPVSVTLLSSSSTRITWTATPTAPLYLNRLAISRNTGVGANAVVGLITPGTAGHPAACTLFAGITKFATLLSNCGAANLTESITYDDSFEASDVTATVS